MREIANRVVYALPDQLRRRVWRERRALSQARRRARERRGDFTRSRPAPPGVRSALTEHLPDRAGFFVEVGANDGYFESNTYELEREHGWHGLLVEPAPELARAARLARRSSHVYCCALVGAEYQDSHIELEYASAMTRVGRVDEYARGLVTDAPPHLFAAPARTLSSLLDEIHAPPVDFLSLDVEGYETEVLRGLEDRHSPGFALIEVGDEHERRASVEEALGPNYTAVSEPTRRDVLYVRGDLG
jgi:FkbM family methyltransferase